ncbi:MAG TPA: ABC transporter ATP-binding protein [Fervidobacterium sp.]|nr:ABC transporter ATP-binding protein [Fervidobacterium sp.]HOM74038.1 ABC transporter ATP-binding protein [Fervidobacterium sp.]HOQ38934.1 ABC transporter ATP-binding protein [Fervidobacterium sp.]HPP17761.1 ABC transporter ATP-binding protein [Fervidobacterium sp.]HPT53530.1 ABC transporter ATP-binding protein [Fervidobacterium sp.]
MDIVSVRDLKFSYGGGFSIDNLNLSVEEGEFFGIIGPNGSGKTTLLSLIMKFMKPNFGKIVLNGKDISTLSHKELAQIIAYIAQDFNSTYDFTVEEIVEMGGIARSRGFFDTKVYEDDLEDALRTVNLLDYRKRIFSTLSGGQQRRVLIARAIYQKTPIILADELVNHLDLGQSLKVMDYLKSLTNMGKTVIGTFHDIMIAGKYCDRIALMNNGKIMKIGIPSEVLTKEIITEIYGVEVDIIPHPKKKYPIVLI